jgi:integrase
MASFRKRGDKWEVSVCLDGVRRSASFPSKREAVDWAARQAVTIKTAKVGTIPDIPLSLLLERYMREVTPQKRGKETEAKRLTRLLRDDLALVRLPCLQSDHLAEWRDRRLSEVSKASVLRDWSLLSNVFTVAIGEWKYLKENPLKLVRKPKAPPPRDRRISELEISRLLLGFGYRREGLAKTITARVGVAFLFAVETGMRAGEIRSLRRDAVKENVAHLSMTKNGFPRSVPLSVEALRLLGQLPKNAEEAFNLKSSQVESLFRKIRSRALIDDLHFHDTRHEAITRLARKIDVLDLARMVGIRDLKILMVYYNATPSEIAARLNAV